MRIVFGDFGPHYAEALALAGMDGYIVRLSPQHPATHVGIGAFDAEIEGVSNQGLVFRRVSEDREMVGRDQESLSWDLIEEVYVY